MKSVKSPRRDSLESVSRRTHSGEARVMSGHGFDLARKRKLDLGIVELLDAGTTALVSSHFLHFDDLHGRQRGRFVILETTHTKTALRNERQGGERKK